MNKIYVLTNSNPLNRTRVLFVLSFFTFLVMNSQTTVNFSLRNSIDSNYFEPVKIYMKKDSIKIGYGLVPWPLTNQVIFVEEKAGKNEITNKDWKVYNSNDIIKMELNMKMYYPVKPKGSGGISIFLFKMHENDSVIFYSWYETFDELIAGGKTITFIRIKNEEKSKRITINFKKSLRKMSKKLAKKLNNCRLLYDEIDTGKYQNSVSDFIKLLDFYDKNCTTN